MVLRSGTSHDNPSASRPPSPRRSRWLWVVAGLCAAALVFVTTVVIANLDAEPEDSESPRLPVRSLGALSRTWEAGETLSSPATVVARGVMVSVECQPQPVVTVRPACVLRGRDIAGGQPKWSNAERVGRTTVLEVIGGAVVVHTAFANANALPNEGSDSLILDPTTGRVTTRVPDARLVAFSERTAVFADWSRTRHVAIDPASGARVWEATGMGELNLTSFAELMPPGSEHGYDTDVPSRWVALPGGTEDSIREIDTGTPAGVVTTASGASASVVDDKILLENLAAHTIEVFDVHGFDASKPNRARWKARLGRNAFAAPCGRLVCVFDTRKPAGKLIDPGSGRVLARSDDGLLFGQRIGDKAIVLECDGRTSTTHPCPIDNARWRLLSLADGAELWTSDGTPVFLSVSRSGPPTAVVAAAQPGTGTTTLTYLSGEPGSVLRTATMAAEGLATVSIDLTGRVQAQYVPNLRCAIDGNHVLCLPGHATGKPTGWRRPG